MSFPGVNQTLGILWLTASFCLSALSNLPCHRDPDDCIDPPTESHFYETSSEPRFSMGAGFGSGVLTTSLLGVTSQARDAFVNTDGSIYVVGRTQAVAGMWQLALTRYLPDGSLDTAFATTGRVIQSLVGQEDSPYRLALDSRARLVIGGRSDNGTNLDFGVWRYHSNGTPDTSFGAAGFASASFGTVFDVGRTLAIDTSGRMVAAGYSLNGSSIQVVLARFQTNGDLDTSFASSGKLGLSFATNATADAIQFSSSGLIYFGGLHGGNSLLGRLISNGSWDTSFFTVGSKEFSFSEGNSAIRDLKFTTRGALVGVGYRRARGVRNFSIFRMRTDNAAFDTRFGTAGLIDPPFTTGGAEGVRLYIGTDNRVLAAGYRNNVTTGKDIYLLRYNSNGTTDTSWTTTLNTSAGDDTPWGFANLKNQEYIIVGQAGTTDSGNWLVVRLNGQGAIAPSGSWEVTFGSAGYGLPTALSLGASTQANAILAQSDGKMVYAGASSGFPNRLNISRWLPSGVLDPSFAGSGITSVSSFSYSMTNNLIQLSDGSYSATMASRIVYRFASNGTFTTLFQSPNFQATGGMTVYDSSFRAYTSGAILSNTLSVRRHNPDGSADTSFATTGTAALTVFFQTGVGGVIDHKFLQPDGKLQVAFSPYAPTSGLPTAMVRFLTNGQIDTGYGQNGILAIGSGAVPAGATLALVRYFENQPDGFIVGEGLDFDGLYGYAFTRYLLSGDLDTSFGQGGRFEYIVGRSNFYPNVLERARGGRYLGMSLGTNGPSNSNFAQAFRLNSDFSLDTSFATRGYADLTFIADPFSPGFHSTDIAEQPDGFIINVRKNAIRYFP